MYFRILLEKIIFKSIFCFKYFFQVFVCKITLILYIQSIISFLFFFTLKSKINFLKKNIFFVQV